MQKWKHHDSYGGFSPDGDYVLYARTRDSQILTESNWDYIVKKLNVLAFDNGSYSDCKGLNDSRAAAYHWRAGHWACGWIEYLMIRHDAPPEIIAAAQSIHDDLESYPVLDEDDYSTRQYDAAEQYWSEMSEEERAEAIKEHGTEESARDDLYQSEMFY